MIRRPLSETYGASVNLPAWDGTPREVAEVWTLRKGSRVASCHLWTHPKRGEIRLTIDGEWMRGEALDNGLALVDLAMECVRNSSGRAGYR